MSPRLGTVFIRRDGSRFQSTKADPTEPDTGLNQRTFASLRYEVAVSDNDAPITRSALSRT